MWEVNGTKKGALPVKVEKRPKGKTVTILSNVYKEPQLLLTQVKLFQYTSPFVFMEPAVVVRCRFHGAPSTVQAETVTLHAVTLQRGCACCSSQCLCRFCFSFV